MPTSPDFTHTPEAELHRMVQHPTAYSPTEVAAAQQELQRRAAQAEPLDLYDAAPARRGLRLLALLGAALLLMGSFWFWYQRQAALPAAPPRPAASPDSLKLEAAVPTPLPKFDVESPILRQLALLPPAERAITGQPMRQYQLRTRRFWLAEYSTEYLIKQAQTGHPDLPVFAQQLATIQSHWRVLHEGLQRGGPYTAIMADHLSRMKQVAQYQQAALSELQADCASQRPPHLDDAANLATQKQVKKLLAPLLRKPAPLQVQLR